ncbi:glycosyltransferase [Nonomuraea phyllanthi]|uniref:Glycosyltransferase n=1 Tax=Nonomuraea phyllanthi TaxID=2219224 RepID=A0A5C4WY98_9ACTN|nr:glycosyltransferase [Nonomuraea phyllanthi]KAB8197855.1 glycosyltransferase [Nonomuraea phyllanthi]QFY06168.1 glycosyltransferase [Nonomuraea phyllanthi]
MDTRAIMEPSPGVVAVATGLASVDIVIPVLNEQRALPGCVRTLARFLDDGFPLPWRITIVDNGSTDATWPVACALAAEYERVHVRRLDIRGRGAALRAAWRESPADVVVYMDVDLSTGLGALFPLVASVASGHAELAIGTRLAHGARTRRSPRRELISRAYNALLRHGFGARFSDAQCGFKAARTDVVRPLMAKVEDDGWFFDTELLLLAEHNGLRVHEVPVDWIEDEDSRVEIVRTALDDLKGLARVAWSVARGRARVAVARPEPTPTHPDAVVSRPRRPGAGAAVLPIVLYPLAYLPLREIWPPALTCLGALVLAGAVRSRAARTRALPLFLAQYVLTALAVLALPAAAGRPVEAGAATVAYCLLTIWAHTRK